jgi:molybdopterin-guanine dinucleotide biosynthesis protein A
MAKIACSAVILAGGESKRLHGQNKALIEIGGRRVMDWLMAVLAPRFDEIILVTNEPLRYLEWDMVIATDHFDQRSSLTGIHAGLFTASQPHVLVTACDMPFIQSAMIELLLDALAPHLDVIIPKTELGFEPMMAIYSKRCLKPMEAALKKRQYQIQRIFHQVRTLRIEEPELRRCDAELISFYNLNSPEDLAEAKRRFHRLSPASRS